MDDHLLSNDSQRLVELDGAGLMRDDRWLVRGVTISVSRGEIVTLIGPNGSGKSTTAKMALGILKPDEGRVRRHGAVKIAYVPQKLTIDWTMPLTVLRFMQLTAKLSQDDIGSALGRVGISHLGNSEVRNLSGGEFQRAMLARAIAQKPNFLVLDEPVQGVDFNGEIALYDLISKIRNELNCGILLISHDLHFVMAATDKVICLNGHMCCQGTPTTVAQSREYRELFGNKAARTLAIYEHDHDHTHLPDGRVQHGDGTITDHCHPDDGHHDHGSNDRNGAPAPVLHNGRYNNKDNSDA